MKPFTIYSRLTILGLSLVSVGILTLATAQSQPPGPKAPAPGQAPQVQVVNDKAARAFLIGTGQDRQQLQQAQLQMAQLTLQYSQLQQQERMLAAKLDQAAQVYKEQQGCKECTLLPDGNLQKPEVKKERLEVIKKKENK